MDRVGYFVYSLLKNKLSNLLIFSYFLISLIEISAEFFKDNQIIWLTKPFIIPALAFFYWRVSKEPNKIFLMALFFNWVANIFFIYQDYNYTIIGATLFLVYRVLIIYLVMRIVKFPGFIPIIISSVPILFVYIYFINLTYISLGDGIYVFILQGIFIVYLMAFAIGNYIFKPSKSSTFLLTSTVFFTVTQFILVLKYCYIDLNIFQPLAMILFVFGQYLLVKFLLLSEKKKVRYEIINGIKANEV